jgi:hypothetical protein
MLLCPSQRETSVIGMPLAKLDAWQCRSECGMNSGASSGMSLQGDSASFLFRTASLDSRGQHSADCPHHRYHPAPHPDQRGQPARLEPAGHQQAGNGKLSHLRTVFQAVAEERIPVPFRSKRVTPHFHWVTFNR